jgi:hypothetical protein
MALSSGAIAIEAAITFGSEPIARARLAVREISPSALLASVDQDGSITKYSTCN